MKIRERIEKVPDTIARTQKTQRQPLDWERIPPAIGPTVEISIECLPLR